MAGSDRLLFGPGGTPNSTPPPRSTIAGIGRVAQLGLSCMEIEFVQGVKMSLATADQVKQAAQKAGIRLTAHGPYAINLNSSDPDKMEASKARIVKTAVTGQACGAESIVFHAGFYGGMDQNVVYGLVRKLLESVVEGLRSEGIRLDIRTELTGKVMDFGTLEELLCLANDIPGLMPCIDFAHMHARTQAFNSYDEFVDILQRVETRLGRRALDNFHAHVSGIKYTERGEVGHLPLEESDFKYQDLLRALKKFQVKGFIVCESPNLEEDALLLQRTYESL